MLAGPLAPAVSGDASRAASRPLWAAHSLARGMLREGAAVPEAEGCVHPLSLGLKDHMQIPSPASATSDRGKQPKQGLQLQTLGCAASVPTSPLCNNPTFSQAWLSIAQSRAEQSRRDFAESQQGEERHN